MSSRARWVDSFSGIVASDLGVPAPRELLDRRDVHVAVVEEGLELGHVLLKEPPVGADRVAAEGHRTRLDAMCARRNARVCVSASSTVTVDAAIVGQSPDFVCISVTKGTHLGELLGRGVEHEVGSFGDDGELVVGDERRDLDDDVTLRFEARHLEVHPHQHSATLPNGLTRAGA